MNEAIRIVEDLADKVRQETWYNESARQSVLTGINMCIQKLLNAPPKS